MQRNIQQITQRFVDRLPENEQFYRPDQLHSWGFPTFIVRRIRIELEKNLKESMLIPKTDWANTQSDKVQNAWQQFVDAIRAEARLPASYAKTVIETAVADVMEILVQPRKNVPSVIFRDDDQLSFDEVTQRVQSVVVYPHFAKLVPRYMQKKELQTLSRERCAKIVAAADEKLTKKYSPLNWAQMLEPLFKMVGGEIDTNLLRLFFEDKKMPRIARKFDLMNDALTRAELIEALSSPDMLDIDDQDEQSSLTFEDQKTGRAPAKDHKPDKDSSESWGIRSEETASGQSKSLKKHADEEDNTDVDTDYTSPVSSDEGSAEDDEDTLHSNFADTSKDVDEDEEPADNENSLNAAFREQEEDEKEASEGQPQSKFEAEQNPEEPSEESKAQFEQEATTANHSTESDQAEEDVEEPADQELVESELDNEAEEVPSENGSEDSEKERPIWMRYMSEEEIEEYKKEQERKEETDAEEQEFIEDPIIDLTNEDATDEEIDNLYDQLEADRNRFVEEIFGGSERAFDQAIEKIAAYNNWREVSEYIKEDIFKRNLVDMYSEAAVDFTDQLQNYFMEKENQS